MHKKVHAAGFMVDMDLSADTMNKKIRNAQLDQYNYILGVCVCEGCSGSLCFFCSVVGEKEVSNETVNVRTRDNAVHGEVTIKKLIEQFNILTDSKALEDPGKF